MLSYMVSFCETSMPSSHFGISPFILAKPCPFLTKFGAMDVESWSTCFPIIGLVNMEAEAHEHVKFTCGEVY